MKSRGKSLGLRLIITIITALLLGGIFLMIAGSGGFFGKIQYGIADYNSVSEADLKKNLPIQGTVYYIYDCIATEYSTDDDGNEKVDSFYYAVPFDDNTVLLVKVKATSALETEMDKLYQATDDSTYNYMFTSGVAVDGILKYNDGDIIDLFDEWKATYTDNFKRAYDIDISGFTCVGYTLDCTSSVSTLSNMFIAGLVMVIIVVVLLVIFIIKFFNIGKKGYTPAPQYNGGYGIPNSTGTNGYNPTDTYSSQQNNNTGNYGFIPQSDTVGKTQLNTGVSFGNTQQNQNFGTPNQQNNSFGFGNTQQNQNFGTTNQQSGNFGFGSTQQNQNFGTTNQQSSNFGFGSTQQNQNFGTTNQQSSNFGFGSAQQNSGFGFGGTQQDTGSQSDDNGFGRTVMPNDLNNNK